MSAHYVHCVYRSVFAAFLWHEGIVHDAMACASFLKFHPDLHKEMSKYANQQKQDKVRTRHATDSSKEINRRKESNMNINETRVRFNLPPQMLRSDSEKSDQSDKEKGGEQAEQRKVRSMTGVDRHKSESNVISLKGENGEDKESQLPPTLHHLVYFWEELSGSLSRILAEDMIYPSPALAMKAKKNEKKDVKEKEKKKDKKKDKAWRRNNFEGVAMGADYAAPAAGRQC